MKTLKIMFVVWMFIANASLVLAEGTYALKHMTPEVEAALNNRRDRFEELHKLKASGVLGENNEGYVEVLNDKEATAQETAQAENKDRKIIYQTIAEQNGLDNAISTVSGVFASVQRDKAEAGDKIQTEDGNWVSK